MGSVTAPSQEQTADMTQPTAEPGTPAEPVVRPAPHRWLWYAFGGRLPARHRSWVLFDTTTDSWWARHVARSLVQMAVPIVAVMTLIPAGWGLRAACAGGGVFLAMIYSLAYMNETVEHRVVKAGFPAGTAQTVRDRGTSAKQEREGERKRAAAAKRAERYRKRTGH
jgi:hypothetical protein